MTMKRAITLMTALILTLSLVACGGTGNDSNDGATTNDSAPLTREGSSETSTPPSTSALSGGDAAQNLDMSAILSGNGGDALISGYDDATKQSIIDDAKADGYDLTFKPDGSMEMVDSQTGEIVIQNPDGSWTVDGSSGDGSSVSIGSGWPDNEFTQTLPKPEVDVSMAAVEGDSFQAVLVATIEQTKAYAEQVKAKGFSVDAETEDQEVMGMAIYLYSAKNADGYRVEVAFTGGTAAVTVTKP
jgi:hypothetical protein